MSRKIISICIIVAIIVLGWIGADIYNDRQYVVITDDLTNIYADLSFSVSHPVVVAIIGPAETLNVLRIRYEKDAMKIKVKTKDGKVGWLWYKKGMTVSKRNEV